MMSLLSEIQKVCSSQSASILPCCIQLPKDESDVGDMTKHFQKVQPNVLTYTNFWKCLALHQVWLQYIVQQSVMQSTQGCAQKNDIDIVIAYISSNSIDMLLSVLASTSSDTIKPVITPALLNTRWTVSEMISSLRQHQEPSTIQETFETRYKTTKFITVLLHDNPCQEIAEHVSLELKNLNHTTVCLPIPCFSNSFLQPWSTLKLNTAWSTHKSKGEEFDTNDIALRKQIASRKADKNDAMILFTSGTTGGSKGVRLSHRALLIQALAKLEPPCEYSEQSTMLATTVPLFHVGGIGSFLAILLARGGLVFPINDDHATGFQVKDISMSLQDPILPANTLVVVPAMLSTFFSLDDGQQSQRQFSSTRLILIGGQSASLNILTKLRETFPNARIVQTYACTEAASSLTFMDLTNTFLSTKSSYHKNNEINGDCVGTPPKHIDLQLCLKPETSIEERTEMSTRSQIIKDSFQLGVIATRGPHVMNGYWKRGGLNESIDYERHWFVSTDLGFWDEKGSLCFGGRIKDVIRTGGETVLAQEVERILLQHPLVIECAVFPRDNERYGEAVACALVTKKTLEQNEIKQWCQQHGLAGYKRPKYIILVEELPRNSSGKVLKHKLVKQYGNSSQSKL